MEETASFFLANRTATAHGPIVRCRDCGFVFTNPRFSNLEYDRIYSEVRSANDLPFLNPLFKSGLRQRKLLGSRDSPRLFANFNLTRPHSSTLAAVTAVFPSVQ